MTGYSVKYLNGMYKLYSKLLAKNIYYSYLDTTNTTSNIYGESKNKVYLEPIQLLGRVYSPTEYDTAFVEKIDYDAVIRICTKSLMDNNISFNPSDYDTLIKGKFTYLSRSYEILRLEPSDNVDDVFIFHDFYCKMRAPRTANG